MLVCQPGTSNPQLKHISQLLKKLYTLGAPVCPVPVWFCPVPAIGGCALIPMLRLLRPRDIPLPPPPLPQTAFNATPPPNNACQPPTHQLQQGRGRGGRGAGRGGSQGRSRRSIGMSAQPPMAGNGQNHTGTGQTVAPSVYNFFNNWGMCFSCGFEVPGWHTRMMFPHECRKPGHQVRCIHQNYQKYVAAGHTVNMKKVAKTMLPSAPTERQT